MNDIKDLLKPENVIADISVAHCGREILGCMARHASTITGIDAQEILDKLIERERLGSTGIGKGIAIPHGKIEGLNEMVGVLARVSEPVDFDSVDGKKVDLFFLLLAPAEANALHLKSLSRIARTLRSEKVCDALRGAESVEAMYAIFTAEDHVAAA